MSFNSQPPREQQQQQQQQKVAGDDKTSTHRIEEEEEDDDVKEDADVDEEDERQEGLEQRSMDSTDFCENATGGDSDDEYYHHQHHSNSKENKRGDSLMLGHEETRAVHAGKCLVFVVLTLAAITMAILTYWFTQKDEQNTFETEFTSWKTAGSMLNNHPFRC